MAGRWWRTSIGVLALALVVVAGSTAGVGVAPPGGGSLAAPAGAGLQLTSADGTSASATPVRSCTVIDEPGTYRLPGNVSRESGSGGIDDRDRSPCIEIRTGDVVLDGQGNVLRGPYPTVGTAVLVNGTDESVSNVTVRNLTVEGWGSGVSITDARNVTATGITAQTLTGVEVRDSGGVTVADSRISADTGVALTSAPNAVVRDNDLGDTFVGLRSERSDGVRVVGNDASPTGHFGGFRISRSDDAVLRNNVANDGEDAAFGVARSDGVRLVNNTAIGNQRAGIRVSSTSDNVTLRRNTVRDNCAGGATDCENVVTPDGQQAGSSGGGSSGATDADDTTDSDGDGLADGRERRLGTDPRNPDTDGDEFWDGDEVTSGTDPLDGTDYPIRDSDGDGATDKEEAEAGTDPDDPNDRP